MEEIFRLLPILVVIFVGLLVSPFQVNAQTFPGTTPLQFNYQSGSDNLVYPVNQVQTSNPIHFNGFWLLVILAIPSIYFVWNKHESSSGYKEHAARGYSIAYQDIRRYKKKTFNASRKSRH